MAFLSVGWCKLPPMVSINPGGGYTIRTLRPSTRNRAAANTRTTTRRRKTGTPAPAPAPAPTPSQSEEEIKTALQAKIRQLEADIAAARQQQTPQGVQQPQEQRGAPPGHPDFAGAPAIPSQQQQQEQQQQQQPAAAAQPTQPTEPVATAPTEHVVEEGDTLSAIAQQYGLSLAEVIRANPAITNPNLIHPGQEVVIPGQQQAPAKAPESPEVADTDPSIDSRPPAFNIGTLQQELLNLFRTSRQSMQQYEESTQTQRYAELRRLLGDTTSSVRDYLSATLRPLLDRLERENDYADDLYENIGKTTQLINTEYDLLYERMDFRDTLFKQVEEAEGETNNPLSVGLAVHRLREAEHDVETSLRRIERWGRVRDSQREQAESNLKTITTAAGIFTDLARLEGQERQERIALIKMAQENPQMEAMLNSLKLQQAIVGSLTSTFQLATAERTAQIGLQRDEVGLDTAEVRLEQERVALERARTGGGLTRKQQVDLASAEINLSRKQAEEALKTGEGIELQDTDTIAQRLVEYRNTEGKVRIDASTEMSYQDIYDKLTQLYGTDIGTGWGWLGGATQEEEARATAEKIAEDFALLREGRLSLDGTGAQEIRLRTALSILGYPVPEK